MVFLLPECVEAKNEGFEKNWNVFAVRELRVSING